MVRIGHFEATFQRKLTFTGETGMAFNMIKASDLIRVNEDGEVIEGNRPVNAAVGFSSSGDHFTKQMLTLDGQFSQAFAIHSGIHKTQPWVIAAAHTHSMYGKVMKGRSIGFRLVWDPNERCFFGYRPSRLSARRSSLLPRTRVPFTNARLSTMTTRALLTIKKRANFWARCWERTTI